MARTDIHRPSVIKPEDYSFVAIVSHEDGLEAALMNAEELKRLRDHRAQSGGSFSKHAHGGSCHICGAGAMTIAYFHHHPSNQYIVTGQDCCAKLEEGHADKFKAIRDEANALIKAKAGKLKAAAILKEAGLEKCWDIYSDNGLFDAQDKGWEEGVIWDIVCGLVRYGSISEKQEAFLNKLVVKIEKRAEQKAKWAAETEAADPVPVTEDRVLVEGQVQSTKVVEGFDGGDCLKMVVQTEAGWKVFGTVPRSIIEDVERGVAVKFMAKISASKNDAKFGFFSRPTKAEIVGVRA